METELRLIVRVNAREANAALRSVQGSIRGLSGAAASVKATSLTDSLSQARISATQLGRINMRVNQMGAKAQAAAAREGAAAQRAEAARTQAYMKQVWAAQVRDARAAKAAEAAAARESAAVQRAEGAQTKAYMKSVWMQQVRDARAAALAQAQAQRAGAAQQVAQTRAQQAMMKGVWMQQVRDARVAKAAQVAADKAAIAAQTADAKQQTAYMKMIWQQQVRDYETAKKEQIAAAKAAAAQIAKAEALAARPYGAGRMGDLSLYFRNLSQRGKELQWLGRQINFNFTLPLLLAAGAATKWWLETERAFIRLKKVYGDGSRDTTAELGKIQEAMRLLSDGYGVNQAEVMELAAAWAAAGAEGADLMMAVRTSLDLSILGDYDKAADTFEDLVIIQRSFKLSSQELALAIAQLNTVENSTAATMQDLVIGLARGGAVADLSGASFAEMASLLATLTPAFGTAATAGNGLKNILQRLMAPTSAVRDTLGSLGEGFLEKFFTLDGVDRLKMIAGVYDELADNQKAWLVGEVAGTFQANRFAAIMRDLNDPLGTYNTTLEKLQANENLAADARRNLQAALDEGNVAQAGRELQTLLQSDPRQMQIALNAIKNFMIQGIAPLIPFLTKVVQTMAALFQAFANLPPGVQSAIAAILAVIIVTGILSQAIGASMILFGQLGAGVLRVTRFLGGLFLTGVQFVRWSATVVVALGKVIFQLALLALQATITAVRAIVSFVATTLAALGPWGIAAVAIIALVTLSMTVFRDEVLGAAQALSRFVTGMTNTIVGGLGAVARFISGVMTSIINFIVGGFNTAVSFAARALSALPGAVASIMRGLVSIVAAAVRAVITLLSYLNPFARHSPSLVDNVRAGVDVIAAEYSRLSGIASIYHSAAAGLRAFAAATAAARGAAQRRERGDQRADIVATSGAAGGAAADKLYGDVDRLRASLLTLDVEIAYQEAAVDRAKDALDNAEAAVDRYSDSLEPLRAHLEAVGTQLDAAKAKLQMFTDAPIRGMRAMGDRIFANEMAQKRLRLEILRMEAAGKGYEDIAAKIAAINGSLESLRARMTELRLAGAGSEILRAYQKQVTALERQRDSLNGTQVSTQRLQDQLEDLQRAGEILDLQNALQFDPLQRQIERLADTAKELTFAQIVAGIKAQQGVVNKLTKEYDRQNAAIKLGETRLAALEARRDALRATYDRETEKLQRLRDAYGEVEQKIRDIEDALSDAAAARDTLAGAGGAGGGGGGGGGGGAGGGAGGGGMPPGANFEDVGGMLEDFESMMNIDELLAQWKKEFGDMWGDILGGVTDFFGRIWNVISRNVKDWGMRIQDVGAGIINWFRDLPGNIISALSGAWNWLLNLKGIDIVNWIWKGIQAGWRVVSGFFSNLGGTIIGLMGSAGGWLLGVGMNILGGLWNGIRIGALAVASFFSNLAGTVKGWVGTATDWLLDKGLDIIGGLRHGIQTGWETTRDWFKGLPDRVKGYVSTAGDWLLDRGKDIISGLRHGIQTGWEITRDWFKNLPSRVKGYVTTAGTWLLDRGRDIISGLRHGIQIGWEIARDWFKNLPGRVKGYIASAPDWLLDRGKDIISGLRHGIQTGWEITRDWFINLPDRVKGYLTTAGTWLVDKGLSVMIGLMNGMSDGIIGVKNWFTSLPGNIGSLFNVLKEKGIELAKGLYHWFTETLNPLHWAQSIIDAVIGQRDDARLPGPSNPDFPDNQPPPPLAPAFASAAAINALAYTDSMQKHMREGGEQIRRDMSFWPANFQKSATTGADAKFKSAGQGYSGSLNTGIGTGLLAVRLQMIALTVNMIKWIGSLANTLRPAGVSLIGGFLAGIRAGMILVTTTLVLLRENVQTWVGDLSTRLLGEGLQLMRGFYAGVITNRLLVATVLLNLKSEVQTWVGDLSNRLVGRGYSLLRGFYSGIITGRLSVAKLLQQLRGNTQTWVGDTSATLGGAGYALIRGFYTGILNAWPTVSAWLSNLRWAIPAILGSPSLYQNGVNIINSLEQGMRQRWAFTAVWLASLNSAIPAIKGPPQADSKLLLDNGRRIMEGFNRGLEMGWADTKGLLGSMTTSLAGQMGNGAVLASTGSSTTNVNINGNLEFPNITSGEDAEAFVRNLALIAGRN